ncbi:MAG TPA: glycosyltransferase family 9 protein [Brumimicrobium sp.]|nr:glycosyltransferase family 9 protein [Brumimicrobium sp.]
MKTIDLSDKTVVISRTDSIGDVILTLPMCAWIKEQFPTAKIVFFSKSYTREVLRCYPYIDEVVCFDEWSDHNFEQQKQMLMELNVHAFVHVFPNKGLAKLAKAAKIPYRIGTSHRLFHLLTCNIRPNFTRKNSDFHEAQLNFQLLKTFGLQQLPKIESLIALLEGFAPKAQLNSFLEEVLSTSRKKVVLHTKSQGSAIEWPLEKYIELSEQLVKENYVVYFSGTEKEGLQFRKELPNDSNIIDISGKSSLGELIAFISKCDVLVACSTGPLHIAAVLGIKAIGLYTDLRPMHPGRWAPLGKQSIALTINNTTQPQLEDIYNISVQEVIQLIK